MTTSSLEHVSPPAIAQQKPLRELRFERALWALPAAFAPHICEEYFAGFSRYVTEQMHGRPMPGPLFLVNNAVFMTILLTLSAWAGRSKSRLSAFVLMAYASANLFWDFFVHLFYTVHSGAFSPGLVTAAFLYYPIPPLVALLAIRDRRLDTRDVTVAFAIGSVLMGLVLWGGVYHFAGRGYR
jgi:Protein of unknown function with HXXEE motif